jgi:hypothetical protein
LPSPVCCSPECHSSSSDLFQFITPSRSDDELAPLQLALYRLRQLGVLNNYFLEYGGGAKRVAVHIRTNPLWTPETGREALRESLLKFILTDDPGDVAAMERAVGALELCVEPRLAVQRLSQLLIERTYQTVKSMRYRMLLSEWEFARDVDQRTCRRAYLRRILGDEIAPDFRCEFCDVCRPDLDFAQQGLAVGPGSSLDQLTSRLGTVLASPFNAKAIQEVVELAASGDALLGIQGRAEQVLQSQPDHQVAFVIAGLSTPLRSTRGAGYA